MFKRPFTAISKAIGNFFKPREDVKQNQAANPAKERTERQFPKGHRARRAASKKLLKYSGHRKYTKAPAIHSNEKKILSY